MPLNEKDLTRIERLAASLVANLLAEYPAKNTPEIRAEETERLANAMSQTVEQEVEALRLELAR